MRKTGTIIAIPVRIPQLSAIHPMNGSISSPGRIHSDAIEKPIDRARGGMARDSEARMPGPTIARHIAMRKLTADRDGEVGDHGEDQRQRRGDRRDHGEEPEDQARVACEELRRDLARR